MIKFSKTNAEGMDTFKNAIREQIIEMASNAISPIYGDWERFDVEIAHKLEAHEIGFNEARKRFAEDFYESDLNDIEIIGNTVVFYDDFNTENTCNDGSYDLDIMVEKLRTLYPDLKVYGIGYIDYHISAIHYILIAEGERIVFSNNEDDGEDWIHYLSRLADGETVDEIIEEDDDFSVEKMREDMAAFLSGHGFKFSVDDLLELIGLQM